MRLAIDPGRLRWGHGDGLVLRGLTELPVQLAPVDQAVAAAGRGSSEIAPVFGNARPHITGNTQGVVGIDNLKLEAGQNATQGSVLTSEKNNVKVESGTMLLLRVNQ